MKLATIAQYIHLVNAAGSLDTEIRGIAYDSRQVRHGYLFVALPGARLDGASFIDDAIRRGAIAIATESREPPAGGAVYLQVQDAHQALAEMACAFYDNPSSKLQTVGITGTNGKTTTAFMIREMLEADGRSPGLIGTIEYQIGDRIIPAGRTTPQSLDLQTMLDQMRQVGCRSVVMEVSSHALAQKRVWGMAFDVAIFTNLTRDHLDYHETMQGYFEAKSLLFQWFSRSPKSATAVINTDDPWGRKLLALDGLRARVVTYGSSADAMVRAADIELSAEGSRFQLSSPWGSAPMRLSLLGRFNISNALAATACGGVLGLSIASITGTLSRVVSVPGRLEEIPTHKSFHVFVDYAHTDDALENVLRTLREINPSRLIVVFGCGGNRDRTKRPVMGAVAARLADYSILTSDNPRKENPLDIIAQIREGFGGQTNFEIIESRAEAIGKAVSMAQGNDILLIAGKGHETYQEFTNTVVPFDDRDVVRKLLT